jgi:putative endonuclease
MFRKNADRARKTTGRMGEQLALGFLKKKGYTIVETNYRCHYGEIDIVARQKDCMVYVEVRTRTSLEFGTPEDSISYYKALHMAHAAEYYQLHHRGIPEDWRVDLVAIELDSKNQIKRIEQVENALGD